MRPTKAYGRFSPPLTTIPSQSPRLYYFISRSNGTFVPLIPADEFPYSVRLAGVPRAMKIEHSCGMSHVGTHAFTGQLFQLEPVDAAQHIIDRINTSHINPSSAKQHPATSEPILYQSEQGRPATRPPPRSEPSVPQQLPVSATATTWRRVDDATSAKSQEIIDNIIAQGSHPPAHKPETALKICRTPSSSPKSSYEQKDKIYCSYWIRSGECDYTQQGCRYKHEMPDKATLASIGFRTVPRWWQEKVAIQLGQSAIPTVGPAMKPAGWLKQRRDSQDSDDSQSDKDSQSEHESKRAAKQVSTNATHEAANEPNRKLSDVDLIDLSPIRPTGTISYNLNDTNTQEIIMSTKPGPARTPPPSLRMVASQQPIASPRKVFVPAGESTEFHVADARKHAQSQKPEPDRIETKQFKAEKPATEEHLPTIIVTTLKPSEPKSGLMASMHAPKPTSGGPRNNDGSSSAKKPQRQLKANSTSSPKKEVEADKKRTVSSSRSRPASQKTGTPSPTTGKVAAVDDSSVTPKFAQSTGKESPKSVCRPRRPAASTSKAVASRAAATGGAKE